MRTLRSSLAPAWLALLLTLLPAAAWGAASQGSMLLLGLTSDARWDKALTALAFTKLERSGEPVLRLNLNATERTCAEPECLGRLAERAHAGLVLGGSAESSGLDSYSVKVWIFDTQKQEPLEREEVCSQCDRDKLAGVATVLWGQLLAELRHPREESSAPEPAHVPVNVPRIPVAAASQPAPPAPQPVLLVPARTQARRSLSVNKKVAITLGLLGGAALVTAIIWNVFDGRTAGGTCVRRTGYVDSNCVYDLVPQYAAGYGVAGGLLLGMTIALAVPERKGG